MRHLALAACTVLFACASRPPPPPAAQHTVEAEEHDAAVPATEPVVVDAPERSRPPSTASYEEAMSTPEALDLHDESLHLTDAQLAGPIRGALAGCRVPYNRKITIKAAVQYGRAIGVTVEVRVVRPKPSRPPTPAAARAAAQAAARPAALAAARAEAKTTRTIVACVDQNVRALVWPPSRRRDSSTTDF